MATAQLVVDADIVIDHLRRRDSVLARVLRRFRCAVTAVTVYELEAVPVLSARQRAVLSRILSQVEILYLDAFAAEKAATVWRALAAKGELIGFPDILSAGICLTNNLPLLTRNADHFRRVEGLQVITPDELAAQFVAEQAT
ncbi:MAG: type II toxin-antitoxin system VapC family toxin [Anaerolineales bacterium]